MKTTIAALWDEYARAVLPPNVSTIQRWELRRSFYAGAFAMLTTFADIGGDGMSEDEGVVLLESLRMELLAFNEHVKQGRA